MIRLEGVGLHYGAGGRARASVHGVNALHDVSFSVAVGGFRWLQGPSGAGKTSLLKLLHLTILATQGQVEVMGQDIANLRRRDLPPLRRRIGMVFQDFRLLPHLSVFDNVALPLRLAGRAESQLREDAAEMLDWVELDDKASAMPGELSGGEQQRVAIARAVVNHPRLLLADEPTGNLDDAQALRLMRLLRELNRLGTTVIVATHNESLVARHPGPTLRLEAGRLVADGQA
jgi:cell division transport system ATP-binding protein